jgi:FixJ family two-component response regulator
VILDLILPEISGPEVLRRLRTINPRARVILSTGQTNATLLRDAREAGAVDCISKPYTLERLAMAIQRNLPP